MAGLICQKKPYTLPEFWEGVYIFRENYRGSAILATTHIPLVNEYIALIYKFQASVAYVLYTSQWQFAK